MCKDCKQPCKELSKDDCFKINETKCDVGCKDVVLASCVFLQNDINSLLPHLGISAGASLNYIVRRIDELFGKSINTNFSVFNFNNVFKERITNIKEFVDAITKKINALILVDETNAESIQELETVVQTLSTNFTKLNGLEQSSVKLNINTGDKTDVVIKKLITYLDAFEAEVGATSFTSSGTVVFSESNSEVTADVKISEASGNLLTEIEDGLYVGPTKVSDTLDLIQNNPELLKVFTALVSKNLPCFYFDLMSEDNTIITYINCIGDKVTKTAEAYKLLQLYDVRTMLTTPSTKLTITFKGIK